ncbi:hypothetical protein GE21DRAFT_8657 [Neurospora crassa]|uniref:Uncharacterized protein n=1 Tax=Neurospora crassa (strain ATCC 24698 / 74-OR23-1A / CBS 708.71 / DSM 1257 / FGSC 987) TaxID=367110 RepID=Q7S5U1_NEUCR|nr:hypothetical protein NCU04690 [Neurospora crassa OR74A]EAA30892.3 hypothetical protein NCU04690 [Neurospora crassa OR74A]KHE81928.1 hypothetical protein GE21DRAFT_8657 [Neurospora crassa]|eukprot:XP_960128.3 hypothetical protein NCU04690 [Neurospora crassa OR74A]
MNSMAILSTCLYSLAGILLLAYGTNFMMYNVFTGSASHPPSREAISAGTGSRGCPHEPVERFRVGFGLGPGATLFGYPSKKGGVYVLEGVLGVELDFLGLDRFHPTPRKSFSDPAEEEADEDAWCYKLRQLGAIWWKARYDYDMMLIGGDIWRGDDPFVTTGWPATGGVWILKTTKGDARGRGVGIIHNAYNMEERCRAIEKVGGVFYTDPKDCPDLDLD